MPVIASQPPPLPRPVVARKELAGLAQPPGPIDLELLMSLPSLPLRARYLVESFMTGRHRSPIKGTSPEFAEYRSYQVGDELRRIDWRLYGRSDRLCVKQFEDENQLRICLALDLSASLRYASKPGSMSKFDFARTLLAAVALLARRQQDAVGLALLGDTGQAADGSLYDFLRPAASLAHHHAVFGRLETPPETSSVSLPDALLRLAALMPRGGLVVLASDFYTEVQKLDGILRLLRSQRVEVIGLHVLDPMEIDFADDSAGVFVDLEDGASQALHTADCRAGYLERFAAFRQELTECFNNHEAELVLLRTDATPLAALTAYLARRSRLA